MARVEHKFVLIAACADCGGHGVKPAPPTFFGRSGICQRCKGERYVRLVVTTDEMATLLAGGSVHSELSGSYTVRAADSIVDATRTPAPETP